MNTQKMKPSWLKAMAAAFAAAVMASGAHGAERITVDKVANHYPWDGKVDCVTTLSGLDTSEEYEGVFTLSVTQGGEDVRKSVTNAFANADGTYTNIFDCAALFGAGFYPNGGIVVDLMKKEKPLGGVQLWADGPYWAECNVGATKPEEYGYYFWWGDTVGYTNTGSAWISVKDRTAISFGDSSPANTTYYRSTLSADGYIDSASNLVAAHDAATAHLGGPWRMPTSDELKALVDHCTTKWITTNGVSGCLVTGKDEYATKSIFLPAAGYGDGSKSGDRGSFALYWSSTAHMTGSCAYGLTFNSKVFRQTAGAIRYYGRPVRPLRGFAQ